MADGIYIASIQPRAGKSLAALGLMELASRRVERLGFFRPVVNGAAMDDREITLMHARYALRDPIDARPIAPRPCPLCVNVSIAKWTASFPVLKKM